MTTEKPPGQITKMSSGKLLLVIVSVLVVAVFTVGYIGSLLAGIAKPAPNRPAPDYGKQFAENYRANTDLAAAADNAATECWVQTGATHGGANVMERSAVQQRIEGGRLIVIVPLFNARQGSRGECVFEQDNGVWLDAAEIAIRRKRNAELSYAASQPVAPTIGMTDSRARASTWGYPDHINTTTTARGTREQWVYSRGRYLYFENGVVTSIQQSR